MCIKRKILLYLVNRISAINCNNVSKVFGVFLLRWKALKEGVFYIVALP